jgi:ketosteroid isomerase-like protein
MAEEQNIQVVQGAYAAFGRRDIAGVLEAMDDSMVWHATQGAAAHVPLAGSHRGKAGVKEFFRLVDEYEQFEVFDPQEFIAKGDKVIVLGHYTVVVKTTGKKFDADWVMVYTMKNGKVVKFQEFADSAAINAAFS